MVGQKDPVPRLSVCGHLNASYNYERLLKGRQATFFTSWFVVASVD